MSLPVLVIAFNRPDLTQELLDTLRTQHDISVYISVDGPRRDADRPLVAQVRELARRFLGENNSSRLQEHDRNQGCARGVTSALHWFFGANESGVVLEDDCLPTPEFIEFCRLGLIRYAGNPTVGSLSGVNYARSDRRRRLTLSKYPQLWGWATWRDRVQSFDLDIGTLIKDVRSTSIWRSLSPIERWDWRRRLNELNQSEPHTWDTQMVAHFWMRDELSLIPPFPLVSNRGFDLRSTHTRGGPPGWYREPPDVHERRALLDEMRLSDELPVMCWDDDWLRKNLYSPPIRWRIERKLSRPFNRT